MKLAALILAMTLGAALAAPPNVALIISDDHHWRDYGFMGHPHVRTPNLDRLSRESLTFKRGYVTSSLCCPSLASLITGLYPHQHKITGNDPAPPSATASRAEFQKSKEFIAGREVMSRQLEQAGTLPKKLAEKGYLSLQTGKWWQGDFRRGGFTHGMTEGERHGDKGLDIGRKTMAPIEDFLAEAKRRERPFFLWYAPMMPHEPHTPPERLLAKYQDKAPSPAVARYWAMVEWFDETCGQLLDMIDRGGWRENTMVIYLADNGWITDPATGKFAPKSKQSPYDGGLRTPIMIRWPGRISPEMSPHLASVLDVAPTVLTAAGLEPRGLPGLNLADEKALAARGSLFGECYLHDIMDHEDPLANLRWRWAIEDRWKLIVPSPRNEPQARIELYDLSVDPEEEKNLAERETERVPQMRQALGAWWGGY